MSVILMRRAVTMPMTAPMPMAAKISATLTKSGIMPLLSPLPVTVIWVSSVVTTAIAIPAMPSRFPRCDVDGDDRPRSARMKHTPAIK